MIDNPLNWIDEFKDYIEEPQEFFYGDFCVISNNAKCVSIGKKV